MSNLTEIERLPILVMNGTPYFRVPKCLRNQIDEDTEQQDVVYARDIDSGELVLRIEKLPPLKKDS